MPTTLENAMSNKRIQWTMEAELNFCRLGRDGVQMVREQWANGQTMVGPIGASANQMIPLERAIEIYRAGWKLRCK